MWNLRLKVALGAAKGLAFLHSSEAKVIYRDFKTSNILLDSVNYTFFVLAFSICSGDGNYLYAIPYAEAVNVSPFQNQTKNSHIVMSQSYNAKLSDFGLAKDGPAGDKSHVSTRVMGTYGYAAPEYLATGMILESWHLSILLQGGIYLS